MPLTGATSYPATLESFTIHWKHVNAWLGAGHELVLPDALTLAGALAMKTELDARRDGVRDAGVDLQIARGALKNGRKALRARLAQFCDLAETYWNGTPWAKLVPAMPTMTISSDKFVALCRDALRLWTLLETEPAPPGAPMPIFLDPAGTFGRADFAAAVAATSAAALAVEEALWNRGVGLARRNAVMARIRKALVAYQRAVPGRLPAGDLLISTMPALWPPPGHTPDAVALAGAWDATANAARLTWEASPDKMLDHYELRACAGPDYDGDVEEVVARISPEEPRELATASLLSAPEAQAAFRIYVVLKTDNERGSGTVVVTRPAG